MNESNKGDMSAFDGQFLILNKVAIEIIRIWEPMSGKGVKKF